jgi:ribonucleoside-diphosphate reductase alpha chain
MDFIDLKKNSGEERRRAHDLFPSLWIGDDFMKAVEENLDWNLYCPSEPEVVKHTMKAKDLWKKILTSYAESGSPFLCFKDTANRANPNSHVGHIRSSNLCTEIFQNTEPNHYMIKLYYGSDENDYITVEETEDVLLADGTTKQGNKITSLDVVDGTPFSFNGNLPIYCVEKHKVDGKTAVCNLASVNLSKIHTKEDFERVIPIAVRMLDNVIDLNYYPLKKVKDQLI